MGAFSVFCPLIAFPCVTCYDNAMQEIPQTPTERVSRYRQRLRAEGLRPVQLWVPDVRHPAFGATLKKEMASLNANHEQEALSFIEAASDVDDWQ